MGSPTFSQGKPSGYGSIPIHTIFNGMNIHLPAILMFTRGTRVLTHCHLIFKSKNIPPLLVSGRVFRILMKTCCSEPHLKPITRALPSGKRLHRMERSTIFNGKIHYKWSFSIAMLNYQRVTLSKIFAASLELPGKELACQVSSSWSRLLQPHLGCPSERWNVYFFPTETEGKLPLPGSFADGFMIYIMI